MRGLRIVSALVALQLAACKYECDNVGEAWCEEGAVVQCVKHSSGGDQFFSSIGNAITRRGCKGATFCKEGTLSDGTPWADCVMSEEQCNQTSSFCIENLIAGCSDIGFPKPSRDCSVTDKVCFVEASKGTAECVYFAESCVDGQIMCDPSDRSHYFKCVDSVWKYQRICPDNGICQISDGGPPC